ncbi:hypothetical protein [Marinobacter sp.]|uniref:hypothetical protein n=1 Tax=Marinobacter sp. TaxID=50741 RepID=UPI003B51A938
MMRNLFIFATAFTLSTSVLAGNMPENKGVESMHSQMKDKHSVENILQDEDMQRLHREMTHYGLSEVGMEARFKMISTEEGRRYHEALKDRQENTAG